MQKMLNRIIPFILLGIVLVAVTFGIMILAYVFFLGAIIGLVLFIINWVRDKLHPPKEPKTVPKPRHKQGRIIDSDDWKEL